MRRYRRYRRRSRVSTEFIAFVAIAFGISLIVSLIVGFIVGSGEFNTTLFVIVFFVTLIATGTIAIILSVPSVRGNIGERKIAKLLDRIASKREGYVINDVIIPSDNGPTSQIDHILFLENGIFVIETKNYSGRIYGNDEQREWTQVLAYGNVKNKLYNPVKQNQTHVYRLKEIIGSNVYLESCVVFLKSNTTYIDSEYVFTPRELTKYIISSVNEKKISKQKLLDYYNKVKYFKDNPIQTNKEHVKEIKQMQASIKNNVCPRCGGELVLRHGPKGDFYGCSNYPRCKFIKRS